MYTEFYGLREKPFNLTPDPKYLYVNDKHSGEKHGDALAHMRYGIEHRNGFVMITGEIGTGKTTVCRRLVGELDANTDLALVFNPKLTALELLRKVNAEFGISTQGETVLDLIETLNTHLLNAATDGRNCVLIIDEAQNLSPEVLEQIRLLSNLETDTEKLLQIILIGQPELAEKLSLYELRQLNQRITARYHLEPLDEQETLEYIAFRLHVAGSRGSVRFEREAIREIFKRSGGTPRVINAICDRALLVGYAQNTRTVTRAIIKRAALEVQGQFVSRPMPRSGFSFKRMALVACIFLVGILLGGGALLLVNSPGMQQARARLKHLIASTSQKNEVPSAVSSAPTTDVPKPQATPAPTVVEGERAPENPWALLEGLSAQDSLRSATTALLRSWNMAMLSASPSGDSAEKIVAFAEGVGLAAVSYQPSLRQLLAVNLPALVQIQPKAAPLWVALLKNEQGVATLSAGKDQTIQVSIAALEACYRNEAVILWQRLATDAGVIRPGESAREMPRIKKILQQAGRAVAEVESEHYDSATANVVAQIQQETGMKVDGLIGPQVRMLLKGWSSAGETPHLSPVVARNTPPAPSVSEGEAAPPALPLAVVPASPASVAVPAPVEKPITISPNPPLVEVRTLPEAAGPPALPPMDVESLQESTPPAMGALPWTGSTPESSTVEGETPPLLRRLDEENK